MTLPNERTRAVINTHDFLVRLISPYTKDGIKKIPKAVRQEALRLLRHYPMPSDLFTAAEHVPDIFDRATVAQYFDKQEETA
jgi:hypothetical protein